MAVSSTTTRTAYVGDGTTNPLTIPWIFWSPDDIQVYSIVVATGVTTLWTRGSQYTITGGAGSTGAVVPSSGTVVGTNTLILLNPVETHLTSYVPNEPFPSEVVQTDFDRLTQMVQYVNAFTHYSLSVPYTELSPPTSLPTASARANKFLAFDGSGNPQASAGTSGVALTQGNVGLALYPQTAAEISASVTPTNYGYPALDVRRYGAAGDWNGSSGTDNLTAFNNAFLVANVSGGVVTVPSGNFRISAPIKMFRNTAFIGAGVGATTITKNTNATILTNLTSVLVCLTNTRPGDVSGNVNCILYVHDAIRALNVEIAHMTLATGSTNPNTSSVDHGIVTSGMSACHIHDLYIQYVKIASYVSPVTFFGVLEGIESYHCGQGPSIEAGTSLSIQNNYSSGCRNYGYYLRAVKYSTFSNNACDSTNQLSVEPAYTDRTVYSVSYELNACYAMDCDNNGQEQCFGTQVKLDSCTSVKWNNSVCISPQSDYTGANQIALFDIAQLAQNVELQNNLIFRAGVTALSGGANAANHHDLYVNVVAQNKGFRFVNNWTCNNLYDSPTTVYGNNVPAYASNLFQGAQLHGEFTPSASLLNATGVTLTYGASNKGRYSIINGWMYIDYYLHLATVAYTPTGAVFVSIEGLPLANQSASQGMLLCDFSSNVTWPTTESFWATIDATLKTGLIRNRTQTATIRADAAAFASGSVDVKFHFTGQIYVGDLVNVT